MISKLLLTAFLALTAENLLFVGGAGLSRALRAAQKLRRTGLYAALVSFFSLASVVCAAVLTKLFGKNEVFLLLRPALFALCTAGVYLLAAFLLRRFLPRFYRRVARFLAPAAINTAVLAIPFVKETLLFTFPQALVYALCAGFAFYLAALLLAQALERCKNPYAPKAFRGLPATLLYIGILSLAFAGFAGKAIF